MPPAAESSATNKGLGRIFAEPCPLALAEISRLLDGVLRCCFIARPYDRLFFLQHNDPGSWDSISDPVLVRRRPQRARPTDQSPPGLIDGW